MWFFEDVNVRESGDSGHIFAVGAELLYKVLELDGLIKTLRERSDLHPLTPPPPRTSSYGISVGAQKALEHNVYVFVRDETFLSLTITLKFTDDGFSLSRKDDGWFEMDFYPRPKLDPSEETRIRELFRSQGNPPHTDYLSDAGRTRILAFEIPGDANRILDLCGRVLREINFIREDDEFDFAFLPKPEASN